MAGAVATRERETGREHVRVKLKKVYNLTGFLQKFTPFFWRFVLIRVTEGGAQPVDFYLSLKGGRRWVSPRVQGD